MEYLFVNVVPISHFPFVLHSVQKCRNLALELSALTSTLAVLNLESKHLLWVEKMSISS